MKRSTIVFVIAAVVVLGLVGLIALPKEAPSVQTTAITAADYSFTAPESIGGGLVRLTLTNNGKEDHQAQLFRLNEGVTLQKFQSTAESAIKALPEKGEVVFLDILATGTLEGGPASITPGGTTEAIVSLKPGQYVLVCFLSGADGVPHAGKGMVKPLTIAAPAVGQPTPPQSQTTMNVMEYAFVDTPNLKAGKTMIQFINNGRESHEMSIIRLKGITAPQLFEIISTPPPPAGAASPPGPPPFESAGGMQAISPGEHAWTTLDLKSGDYVYVCFVPSAKDGKPHAQLGMFKPFTVP